MSVDRLSHKLDTVSPASHRSPNLHDSIKNNDGATENRAQLSTTYCNSDHALGQQQLLQKKKKKINNQRELATVDECKQQKMVVFFNGSYSITISPGLSISG